MVNFQIDTITHDPKEFLPREKAGTPPTMGISRSMDPAIPATEITGIRNLQRKNLRPKINFSVSYPGQTPYIATL
jgi:hypothetical protein